MRCRGEAAVSDPTVEVNCALMTFPLCALLQLRRWLAGAHRPPGPRGSQAHRFGQLGHIQCGGQVKVQTARRDPLFLSIDHAPMDKMHPKGTCGSGRLRFIIIGEGP
jgi:hypothetical protein